MTEVWRDIAGYEGIYQVSDQGRVRNKKRRRLLRPNSKKTKYLQVTLSKNNIPKFCSIHRLVAIAFLPNPLDLPQVNHINGIKTDNRLVNLEWCSRSENQYHRYHVLNKHGGYPKKAVVCIETNQVYESIRSASQALNINRTSITSVISGRNKTAGGFHFKIYEKGDQTT